MGHKSSSVSTYSTLSPSSRCLVGVTKTVGIDRMPESYRVMDELEAVKVTLKNE